MFWKDSVRKNGNRIRVTAQLIYAQDGTYMWAACYDRIKPCVSVIGGSAEIRELLGGARPKIELVRFD